jgi:hypothetical protein
MKIAYKILGWKASKKGTSIWRNIRKKLKDLKRFRASFPTIYLMRATVRCSLKQLRVIRPWRI